MPQNLECQCGLRQHIQKMIDKCKVELEEMREGHPQLPAGMEQPTDAMMDILEERYEHLENLQSMLQFMLDYPEREQIV